MILIWNQSLTADQAVEATISHSWSPAAKGFAVGMHCSLVKAEQPAKPMKVSIDP